MKLFWISIISLLLTMTSYSHAQEYGYIFDDPSFCSAQNFYMKIFSGPNFLDTRKRDGVSSRYDTGFIVSGSLGFRWCYGLRVEGEYAYRHNSLNRLHFLQRSFKFHGQLRTSSYMANLLWDLPLFGCQCSFYMIQPYVGGGIGYDFQRTTGKNQSFRFKDKNKGFAWQVMAGLAYALNSYLGLSVEYKFHKGSAKDIYNHAVGLGLDYKFSLDSLH